MKDKKQPSYLMTPRMKMRPPMKGDGAIVAEAIAESWDNLHQWLDWAKDRNSDSDPEKCEKQNGERIEKFLSREELAFHCFEKETDKFIGMAGLGNINWSIGKFTAWYWIRLSEQNKGYATEAVTALLIYAFRTLGARGVGLGHKIQNHASHRVIEKLGFRKIDERDGAFIYVRENLASISMEGFAWPPEMPK